MKKLILAIMVSVVLGGLVYAATGGGSAVGIRRANRGAVLSVNGQKGNVTVTTGGLPLPSGDTTYLQINASQTVTGSPVFIAVGSMTSVGTVSSTSGFKGGLAQFSSMTVAGTVLTTGTIQGGLVQATTIFTAAITSTGSATLGSLTVSSAASIGGDLAFQTTYYIPVGFPFAVLNTTNAIINSSNSLNGLAFLDGASGSTPTLSSTLGNACYFRVPISPNFVAGSTPVLRSLQTMTTGYVDQQESWVLSFATAATYAIPVSTGSGAPSLNFSSSVVVNITGVTGVNGGERINTSSFILNGVGNMIGSGNDLLYIRAVRDSTSANNSSKSNSAIDMIIIAARFQQ